ncbi:MAG TPA: hypothetical protein VJ904_04730, partial [Tichowtungia sp.]|nr:hypothetical protein [Tichowtungia sp.]
MHAKRIFWKLYPSYLIVTLLALAAVYFFSSSAISRFFEAQIEKSLTEQARLISRQVDRPLADAQIDTLSRISDVLSSNISARITLILPDGKVAGDSDQGYELMGNHRNRPEIMDALAGYAGRSMRYSNTLKKNMMYVAVPVAQGGRVIGVVRTAMPLTEMEQVIGAVQHRIVLGGLV